MNRKVHGRSLLPVLLEPELYIGQQRGDRLTFAFGFIFREAPVVVHLHLPTFSVTCTVGNPVTVCAGRHDSQWQSCHCLRWH